MSLRDDLAADLADIFEELDETAVVTPASGAPAWDLPGKLRSPYRAENFGALEVGSQNHRYLCRTVDKAVGNLKKGDTLTVDGENFKVIEPQDGNPTAGMSTLQLAPI